METKDFVCRCFGIDSNVIDGLCDDFDVYITDDDVFDAFSVQRRTDSTNAWNIGRELLYIVFRKIVDNYPELDEDMFDWDVSSPSCPDFYYGDEHIRNKEDLDRIIEQLEK